MAAEQHAVVIGGSLAGLLTARVLADTVDRVTIVERDDLPDGPDARRGVPQGRHAHGLLPAGEAVIRDLFPGLLDELVAGGAQRVQATSGRWWQCGGYRIDAPQAPDATFLSRPYLEASVRARVTALDDVTVVHAATRQLVGEGDAVRGVSIETGEGRRSRLDADLVVDASGRASQAARWLDALGYPAPPVSQVTVDIAYASRLYRRTPGRVPDGSWYVTIGDAPASKRFGVAFPIEGDRWIVTVAGCHGDHPPTDDEGHRTFAESLPTGDIAGILRDEAPLGPIVPHHLRSNQWRHYDKLRRHPAGFVVLGDAICSFNPIYGQGMSSAAQQAAALATCVGDAGIGSPALWRAFYKKARKIIANPWAIAVGGDFTFPETTGPKPPATDLLNRYVRKAAITAQHDATVATALWEVQGLLAPPPSLLRPAMLVRVLRRSRPGPTGNPSLATVAPPPQLADTVQPGTPASP